MGIQIQRLSGPAALSASAALIFTASSPTRIDQSVVANSDLTTAYDVTVWLVPSGSTAVDATLVVPTTSILRGASVQLDTVAGNTLNKGDAIWAKASSANKLNLLLSGTVTS